MVLLLLEAKRVWQNELIAVTAERGVLITALQGTSAYVFLVFQSTTLFG